MTRTERMLDLVPLLCVLVLAVSIAGQAVRQCSERGAGTLTLVFGLNSETSVLVLHYVCDDGSWRKESIWIGDPDVKDENYPDSMLLRFAAATNAATGKRE